MPPRRARSSSPSRRTPSASPLVLVVLVGVARRIGRPDSLTPLGLASAIGSGALYYAGAYWFYLGALRHVPASFAGDLVLPDPDRRHRRRCAAPRRAARPLQWVGASSSWARSWPSSGCRRRWPHDPLPTPRRRANGPYRPRRREVRRRAMWPISMPRTERTSHGDEHLERGRRTSKPSVGRDVGRWRRRDEGLVPTALARRRCRALGDGQGFDRGDDAIGRMPVAVLVMDPASMSGSG